MKNWILTKLGLQDVQERLAEVEEDQEDIQSRLLDIEHSQEDTLSRVREIEETQEELRDLKGTLQNKTLEGQPQYKYVLSRLEKREYSKKELVEELQATFDMSQTTAYRRINELEDELQYIKKTENGYTAQVELD